MSKSILIIDSLSASEYFVNNQDKFSEAVPICVSVVGSEYLNQHNILYKSVEDYISIEKLKDCVLEPIKLLIEACEEIDFKLNKWYESNTHDLNLADINIYIIFTSVIDTIYKQKLLVKALLLENVDSIVTISRNSNAKNCSVNNVGITGASVLYSFAEVADYVAKNHIDIKIPPITKKTEVMPKTVCQNCLKEKIKKNSILYPMGYIIKKYGVQSGLRTFPHILKNMVFSKKKLAVLKYSYDWFYMLPELYNAGYNIVFLNLDNKWKSNANINFNNDFIADALNEIKSLENIQGNEFIARQIENILISSYDLVESEYNYVEMEIKKISPDLLLSSGKSGFRDYLVTIISRRNGISVISWDHGGLGLLNSPFSYDIECKESDIVLCFGEGVMNKYYGYAELFGSECPKIYPVGSFELRKLFSGEGNRSSKKYSVVYATSHYMLMSSISFLETQKKILDYLGRNNIVSVLKKHVAEKKDYILDEYITNNNYKTIKIIKNEDTYTNLISQADVVILDNPQTTLLQGLASHKTIFALTKFASYNEESKKELNKFVYCSDDIDELLHMVDQYLKGNIPKMPENAYFKKFMEEYAIGRTEISIEKTVINILREVTE